MPAWRTDPTTTTAETLMVAGWSRSTTTHPTITATGATTTGAGVPPSSTNTTDVTTPIGSATLVRSRSTATARDTSCRLATGTGAAPNGGSIRGGGRRRRIIGGRVRGVRGGIGEGIEDSEGDSAGCGAGPMGFVVGVQPGRERRGVVVQHFRFLEGVEE